MGFCGRLKEGLQIGKDQLHWIFGAALLLRLLGSKCSRKTVSKRFSEITVFWAIIPSPSHLGHWFAAIILVNHFPSERNISLDGQGLNNLNRAWVGDEVAIRIQPISRWWTVRGGPQESGREIFSSQRRVLSSKRDYINEIKSNCSCIE